MSNLLELTDCGLYCPAGDFYIDPWRGVPRAIITHAHSDHARWGSEHYLTARVGVDILRQRVGNDANIEGLAFDEVVSHHGVKVSLHPAGHILGSAQVRVEHQGEVWVVSGDYKTTADSTCDAFTPIRCHTFITESTFALPIYRWRASEALFDDVNRWWRANQAVGRTSVIFAYSLGKAQRVLAGLDASIGPILMHGAVEKFYHAYQAAGIALPPAERATTENAKETRGRAMLIAPPSADDTPWLRKFGDIATAVASGWMQIRGARRRQSLDRGFPISDHADWDGLLSAIDATGAQQVIVTHGYRAVLTRWLQEHGKQARSIRTAFEGEIAEERGGDQGSEDQGLGESETGIGKSEIGNAEG